MRVPVVMFCACSWRPQFHRVRVEEVAVLQHVGRRHEPRSDPGHQALLRHRAIALALQVHAVAAAATLVINEQRTTHPQQGHKARPVVADGHTLVRAQCTRRRDLQGAGIRHSEGQTR
ncbi:hypothetical protein D3C72_2050210 [compost metagenome]